MVVMVEPYQQYSLWLGVHIATQGVNCTHSFSQGFGNVGCDTR